MPRVFNPTKMEFEKNSAPIPHFSWKASRRLEDLCKVQYYSGEENVRDKWPAEKLDNKES